MSVRKRAQFRQVILEAGGARNQRNRHELDIASEGGTHIRKVYLPATRSYDRQRSPATLQLAIQCERAVVVESVSYNTGARADSQAGIDQILALHRARDDGDVGRRGVDESGEALHGARACIAPGADAWRVAFSQGLVIGARGECNTTEWMRERRIEIDALEGEIRPIGEGALQAGGAARRRQRHSRVREACQQSPAFRDAKTRFSA